MKTNKQQVFRCYFAVVLDIFINILLLYSDQFSIVKCVPVYTYILIVEFNKKKRNTQNTIEMEIIPYNIPIL